MRNFIFQFIFASILLLLPFSTINAQSLDIPVKGYGISFGNSKDFTGLRINFRDQLVKEINGVNITLWRAKNNEEASVSGISVGLIPEAGRMQGIQLGAVGVAGEDVSGISIGVVGVGSSMDLNGINIGGIGVGADEQLNGISAALLGVGSGNEVNGLAVGGLGAGAGNSCTGIIIGGLGAGAGNYMSGITIGGLGAGAGNILKGIAIGGLGAGAGDNAQGIVIGGLGAGAGNNFSGIAIGGLGAGSGNAFSGIAIGGIGAGAPNLKGLAIGGAVSGGYNVTGVTLALGWINITDHGSLTGFSASAFNQVKGRQSGVSVGILNYAWTLNGIQFGLINFVRDNPKYLKILPVLNVHFD